MKLFYKTVSILYVFFFSCAFVYAEEIKFKPLGGVKYDSVLGPSLSGCLLFPKTSEKFNGSDDRHFRGHDHNHVLYIAQIEPGYGGGKLELGAGVLYMTGIFGKLSLLRTWNESYGVEPNLTYIGGECQFNAFLVNLNIGVYRHIGGDKHSHNSLITFGFGFGV